MKGKLKNKIGYYTSICLLMYFVGNLVSCSEPVLPEVVALDSHEVNSIQPIFSHCNNDSIYMYHRQINYIVFDRKIMFFERGEEFPDSVYIFDMLNDSSDYLQKQELNTAISNSFLSRFFSASRLKHYLFKLFLTYSYDQAFYHDNIYFAYTSHKLMFYHCKYSKLSVKEFAGNIFDVKYNPISKTILLLEISFWQKKDYFLGNYPDTINLHKINVRDGSDRSKRIKSLDIPNNHINVRYRINHGLCSVDIINHHDQTKSASNVGFHIFDDHNNTLHHPR